MNNFKTLGLGIAIVGVVATMVGVSYAQQTTATSTDDTNTSMNKYMGTDGGNRNHMKRGMMKQGKHGPKGMAGLGMKGFMNQDPALKAALEANDYTAFSTALKAKKADATIPTAEQFADMVKHYQQHKAIDTALEANDYEAFKAAAKDSPMINKITTAEQFATLAQFHKAVKAGDTATIEKLKASGTLPMMGKGHKGGRHGMNEGMNKKQSRKLGNTQTGIETNK